MLSAIIATAFMSLICFTLFSDLDHYKVCPRGIWKTLQTDCWSGFLFEKNSFTR